MTDQSGSEATDHGGVRPKNIVICLDGTNNELDNHPTNAAKIFMMLDLDHPDEQVAYYDPGVGTLPSAGAVGKIGKWWSQVGGLAFGWGMKGKVSQAYAWLMDRYRPGDRVYIFGFSRGAFTARALAGLLACPGMLRAGSSNLVAYAVKEYVKPIGTKKAIAARNRQAEAFADALCWGTRADPVVSPAAEGRDEFFNRLATKSIHAVPIEYLGIWDTVEAWAGGLGRLDWADTSSLWNVRRLRHAVAIDEWRRPYRYVPVDREDRFEEVWFSGVHCDVGGTFDNDHLATIALKWVFDGAGDSLLLRDGQRAEVYAKHCTVQNSYATEKEALHSDFWAWRMLGPYRRPIPDDAILHWSVRERRAADPSYLPNLANADAPDRWADETWVVPAVSPPEPVGSATVSR